MTAPFDISTGWPCKCQKCGKIYHSSARHTHTDPNYHGAARFIDTGLGFVEYYPTGAPPHLAPPRGTIIVRAQAKRPEREPADFIDILPGAWL